MKKTKLVRSAVRRSSASLRQANLTVSLADAELSTTSLLGKVAPDIPHGITVMSKEG